MVSGAALALEGVSFRYGDRLVLDDISFVVADGRLLGLLGPNGSGKSTAVRLAAGLLPPAAGRVLLGGQPISSLRRGEIARRVAVVPQAGHLPDDFTGGEIVLAGRAPHLGRFGGAGAADREAVHRALTLADAAPFAARRAGELSGGERQRLLLARALAQEPEVLLLDEPTAHLDLYHQLALLDRVRALARDGLAVLAVFHDLNLAAEYCDEIVLLRDGRIQAEGAPETVLTAAGIADVYDVAVPMLRHPQSGRPVVLVPGVAESSDRPSEAPSPQLREHPSPQPLSPCAGRGTRAGYRAQELELTFPEMPVTIADKAPPAEAPRPAHGERGWGEGFRSGEGSRWCKGGM